jgi:DNA-binding IclR family transcriptional regulator
VEARKRWPVELPLRKGWTFITSHAQVLVVVARDPHVRVSEIAEAVGITERYTYRLLSDLQKAGYVTRSRHGRRNEYRVNSDLALGPPLVEEQSLRELLRLIDSGDTADLVITHAP